MKMRRIALVAAAATLAAAPAAHAQAAKPAPCTGKMLVNDPAGDAFVGFVGLVETPMPAGENVDITGIFVNNIAGKVTFNLSVVNLDKKLGDGATANIYRLNYDVGDASNYLQASVLSDGTVAYTYGHLGDTGLVQDGETTGGFFEGKDGVISIDVPATHGGKPGTKWAGASLFSAYVRGRVNTQTDEAPDAGGTFAYNGFACPTQPGAAPGETTPPPGGGTTPPPSSGPAPGPGPTSGPSGSSGPLKVTVAPTKLKAKKVRKAKKVSFNLRPSEGISNLVITLKKGSKSLGAAKLASLPGATTVTLKLKRKGLKKGTYSLVITGKRSDGSTGTVTVKIKVS